MSCSGVLFALKVKKLRSFETDEQRLDCLQEEIEEVYFSTYPEHVAELDRSWDALHRSLIDGKLEYDSVIFPSNHIVLGGNILYTSGLFPKP